MCHLRRRRTGLQAVVGIAVAGAAVLLGASPALALSTPPPPTAGQLGAAGPCGTASSWAPNPLDPFQGVHVYSPTGTATPRTGGTCGDARRPAVFIAHGYGGSTPLAYPKLISHLVSNGHIVVFAEYTLVALPDLAYGQVDAGFVKASTMTSRMNLADVGFWGHSYGAGMTPYLVQRAAARGWGSHSLWMAMYSAFYAYKIGTGPITVPAHTRALVVHYDGDFNVDARIGIELFGALQLPAARKQHVTVRSECRWFTCLTANHFTPTLLSAEDSLDFYGTYRNVDALSACARTGASCNVDLSSMGTWSDGRAARTAVSTDTPTDSGPIAAECWWTVNPRRCP